MDLLLSIIKVLICAFVLFTVARLTYEPVGRHSRWSWVALIGLLAIGNMAAHRFVGSSINPPFFTAVLFGITIYGLSSQDGSSESIWHKRAVYAIAIGTIIGWSLYAELVNMEP